MHLTTDRLVLREYADADLPAFLAYQADPRAQAFYGPDDGDPAALATLVPLFRRWAAETPRRHYQLAIAPRSDPRALMGSCALRDVDPTRGEAQFGLELAPDWWGRGLATEASRAMLDAGFGELGLRLVRGETVSANDRIGALLRRLGFREAGGRAGPDWMRARGGSYALWELGAADWVARGGRVARG